MIQVDLAARVKTREITITDGPKDRIHGYDLVFKQCYGSAGQAPTPWEDTEPGARVPAVLDPGPAMRASEAAQRTVPTRRAAFAGVRRTALHSGRGPSAGSGLEDDRRNALPMHFAFFHAPWCGVCHEKAPLVERIAEELEIPLESWNIEEPAGREEAKRRGVKTVPTLALVRGDRVPFRLVGRMITPENIEHLLDRFVTPPE